MNYQEAKEQALLQEPEFLPKARSIGGKQSYICPCCSNGSGKNGTGITQIPGTESHPTYHCFKCDFVGDIFELAKEYYHCNTNKEAFKAVFDFFGITFNRHTGDAMEDHSAVKRMDTQRVQPESQIKEPETDYMNYLKQAAENLDPSYLLSRGISEKTQKHYMVGTDRYWVNPIALNRYKEEGKNAKSLKKSPRCIIPTSRYSYLARDIRDNLSESAQKYAKQKVGKVRMFNEKYAERQEIMFVTEGEIDAMSIYEVSNGCYEALGLSSTANWRKLVKLEEQNGYKPLILALDNDKAGGIAAEKIIEALGDKTEIILMEYEGKDPNSALEKDLKNHTSLFKQAVISTMDQMIEKLSDKQIESEEERE